MTEAAKEPSPPSIETAEQLFRALWILDQRCRENAVGLPERDKRADIWAGVLFYLGELPLLAPLEEIGQVLEVPPEATPIPGTKDWVFGVANNRGTLLPMFDLQAFLSGSSTSRNPRNRVLVVRRDEFPLGLLVSGVTGIRHFQKKSHTQAIPDLPAMVAPYVSGGFRQDRDFYPVFSVSRLTQDEKFNLVGA